MKGLIIAGEILPIFGTISLFGLWLFQQNEIERHSNELQKLNRAYNTYQTYQSNNAIFNAVNLSVNNSKGRDSLRIFQTYNYELGLYEMKMALHGSATSVFYSSPGNVGNKMKEVQNELETLQNEYFTRRELLEKITKDDKNKYFWIFIIVSFLSLAGSVCKAVDKISSTKKLYK